MKSRYFLFIYCAGVALLFLFGQTAAEVITSRRPADAPPLSVLARIGVVLATLISAASLLQLTVHLINSRFFPQHPVDDPLCRKRLGPIIGAELREEYPSRATIAQHELSGELYWEQHADLIAKAKHYMTEHNTLPNVETLEGHIKADDPWARSKVKAYIQGVAYYVGRMTPAAA